MATRATYQVCRMTFYCHWDGYPEGAAGRFWHMVDAMTRPASGEYVHLYPAEDRRGGPAFAFIRGVLDAEPTESHDAHGDTEYRYTVGYSERHEGRLYIEVRERRPGQDWRIVTAHEPLAEWVNRKRRGEDVPPLVEVAERRDYGAPVWHIATAEHADAIARTYAASADGIESKWDINERAIGRDPNKSPNPNVSRYRRLAEDWARTSTVDA